MIPDRLSIRVDRLIEPSGIPDRSSRSSPLGSPIDRVDRALGDPRKRVEVGSSMRQYSKTPSLFDGVWGVVGRIHLTIVTGGWGVVVCSCLGVNRINFDIHFDGFFILFRPINRKT